MEALVVGKQEWDQYAEQAHLISFSEIRPAGMNRYDYAIVVEEEKKPQAYVTVRELDAESVYLSYGGVFPDFRGTKKSFESFGIALDKLVSMGIKSIMFYVSNKNIKMINFAHAYLFLMNGCRVLDGEIYIEFLRRQ